MLILKWVFTKMYHFSNILIFALSMTLARKQDRLSKQLKVTKTLWIAYNKVYSFLILHNQKCAPAALCLNCHSKIHPLSVITEL